MDSSLSLFHRGLYVPAKPVAGKRVWREVDHAHDISPLSPRKGFPVGNGKAGERIIVYRNRIANQKNVLTITLLRLPLQAKESWFRNPATSLEDFEGCD